MCREWREFLDVVVYGRIFRGFVAEGSWQEGGGLRRLRGQGGCSLHRDGGCMGKVGDGAREPGAVATPGRAQSDISGLAAFALASSQAGTTQAGSILALAP